jgi:predicted site-specific integrase-resolvase
MDIESIKNFVKRKHPKYKEGTAMFKRRFVQYARAVSDYRKNNLENDLKYSSNYCLNKLYPKPKINKSMIIIFD